MAKLKKSLPKRCTNEKLKVRRKTSYERGEARKLARVAAQKERELANNKIRGEGGLTPHELKLLRASQRPAPDRPRVRNDVGNFLVERIVSDEHGSVIIQGIEPCCSAKSYLKCNCNSKVNKLDSRERYALMKNRSQYLATIAGIVV
jgi:hypothetical protein